MCLNNEYLGITITNGVHDEIRRLNGNVFYSSVKLIIFTFQNTTLDEKVDGITDKSLNMKDTAATLSVSERVTRPVHSIQSYCKFVPMFNYASCHEDMWESGGIVVFILNLNTT
jgi:hypothetical protein